MTKRGQITVFIIVGIVVLLLVAVIFYFQQGTQQVGPKRPLQQKLGPVEEYISSCVEQVSTEAILQLGQRGGYVYPPAEMNIYPSANIFEDGIGFVRVPLWYFQDNSYMPSIEEMQYQIYQHLSLTMKACLNNFKPLENEYTITQTGDPTFKVTIAEEDVAIEVFYPLDVVLKARNEQYKVEKFFTFIPARLKKVYSLARAIFEEENSEYFLENLTLQMMTSNPDIPFTGVDFSCSHFDWDAKDVKNQISDMVAANMQFVRFKNTNYPPFLEDERIYRKFQNLEINPQTGEIKNLPRDTPPKDLYYYSRFFFDVTSEDYKDLSVNTIYYREWPMTINAIPSDNGKMTSETLRVSKLIPLFCMEMWHFVYDVTYNVEFIVRDQDSFGGRGYNFKFAMPVIIYHNRPKKLPLSAKPFLSPVGPFDICTDLSTQEIDIRAFDVVTNAELPRVNITYQCLNYLCTLGTTRGDYGVNRLRTFLPSSCANPLISGNRDDYMPGQAVAPQFGMARIPMVPLKRFNFNITKVIMGTQLERPIEPDEAIFISLKNSKYNYTQNIVYPDITGGNLSKLMLLGDSSSYETEIFISRGDNLIGGWSGNWSASAWNVYNSDTVVFRVMAKIPYPVNDSEVVDMLNGIKTESLNFPPVLVKTVTGNG